MSASETFAAPIVRHDISFPRLLTGDYAALESVAQSRRVQRVQKHCQTLQITNKQEVFAALQRADGGEISSSDVYGYVRTWAGSQHVFRRSLAKDKKTQQEADAVFAGFLIEDATRLALELLGFAERIEEELIQINEAWPLLDAEAKKELARLATDKAKKPPLPEGGDGTTTTPPSDDTTPEPTPEP